MFIKCKSIFSETFKLNLQNSVDPVWLDTSLWSKMTRLDLDLLDPTVNRLYSLRLSP